MSRGKVLGDLYKIGEVIGSGAFSVVYTCTNLHTKEEYAVKVLSKQRIRGEGMESAFQRECHALRSLKYSRYITNVVDILQSSRNYYVIMDLANGGTLLSSIVRSGQGGLAGPKARKYFRQILQGINDIHISNVVHRDIKPENVLFDSWQDLKISDFGFATYAGPEQILTRQCGTPQYVAPEVVQGQGYNGRQADVWSAGVTLYVMLFGSEPFFAHSTEKLYEKIVSGKFSIPERNGYPMASPAAIHLLSVMMCVNPDERWTIPQLLMHPWVLGRDEMPTHVPDNSEASLHQFYSDSYESVLPTPSSRLAPSLSCPDVRAFFNRAHAPVRQSARRSSITNSSAPVKRRKTPNRKASSLTEDRLKKHPVRRLQFVHVLLVINFICVVGVVLLVGSLRVLFDIDVARLPLPDVVKLFLERLLAPPISDASSSNLSRSHSSDSLGDFVFGDESPPDTPLGKDKYKHLLNLPHFRSSGAMDEGGGPKPVLSRGSFPSTTMDAEGKSVSDGEWKLPEKKKYL